jgi:hypothetical protein
MREFLGRVFGGASEERWSSRQESEAPRRFFSGESVKVMIEGSLKDGWRVIQDENIRLKKNDWIMVGLPNDSDQDLEGFAFQMRVSREKLMEWNQKKVE